MTVLTFDATRLSAGPRVIGAGTLDRAASVARAFGILALLVAPLLDAAAPSAVHDLFVIERNKNRNLVQYRVRLDADCVPAGDEPIDCYWRMLEKGPDAVEAVGLFEQAAYGIGRQECHSDGLIVRLKALPERVVTVRAGFDGGACRARAYTRIDGAEARLTRVYVMADEGAWLPSVLYVDLFGVAADGREVRERLREP